jgi:DNA end-binding protein Ku
VLDTDEELASLQPRATHTIDLEEFVDLVDVDPIYFDGAYHVAPDDRAGKSYALLVEAMEQAGKVAVARFVMRSKQYVAIMRPRDGRLVLSMMVYEDEINPATEIPEFDQLDEVEINERELAMAEQLIESLSAEWEPDRFHDTYRDELLDLIHAKDQGKEVVVEAVEGPAEDTVIDLMAALEASVAAARESRKRHPSTGTEAADDAGDAGADDDTGAEVVEVAAAPTRTRASAAGPAKKKAGSSRAKKAAPRKATAKKAAGKKSAPKKAAAARKSA